MIVKDALKILEDNGIRYSFFGDDSLSFSRFAQLNEAGPGDAAMVCNTGGATLLREKSSLSTRILLVNKKPRPTLAIVPIDKVDYFITGAVIGVENPRLAFAFIQRELISHPTIP